MTEEEQEKYYQPPKPAYRPPKIKKDTKKYWVITFIKDWERGEKYPEDKSRIFTGSPYDFVKFVNCNRGLVYRMISYHLGEDIKQPLRRVCGYSIARIRKYDKPTKNGIHRKYAK